VKPKKHILLIDPDDAHCSVMSFTLRTRGLKVTALSDLPSISHSEEILNEPYDLVVFFWGKFSPQFSMLINALRKRRRLVLTFAGSPSLVSEAESFKCVDIMRSSQVPMAEMIEDIHLFSARKRGPRKKSVVSVELDLPSTFV
jgi:hypothetical protein